MSKRPFKPPPGFGGNVNKVPRLEVTISEHNFPLSQNIQQKTARESTDVWGDDNEDDFLLQASQACEENSQLPNYSNWQPPASTSTQLLPPNNETSHTLQNKQNVTPSTNATTSNKTNSNPPQNFTFKTPATNLKLTKEKTSSPLCDFNAKENLMESFVMDDMRGDAEHFYKKLLHVQEENAKLKSENSKLLEQALSKDGEVTILRGRLKSCQSAVDAARLERLQASERMQVEWTERLTSVNKQVGSLRTQLDCKELEVARMRERCKMLESNKIKLTQAPMQLNSTFISQQPKNFQSAQNDTNGILKVQNVNKNNTAVQTDLIHNLKLNLVYRSKSQNKINTILPLLLKPEVEQPYIFQELDADYSQRKYNLVTLDGAKPQNVTRKKKINISGIYKDLSVLAMVKDWNFLGEEHLVKCLNILKQVKAILTEVAAELEAASTRVTLAFQRDLDDKYIKEIKNCQPLTKEDLFSGEPLFKEEQQIVTRRGIATLAMLCSVCQQLRENIEKDEEIIKLMTQIISLLSAMSCAVQFSGLLLSIVYLISNVSKNKFLSLVKDIILSRPSLPVILWILSLLKEVTIEEKIDGFCLEDQLGNLRLDFDQGSIMFRKESCTLQVFMCQLETCFKCLERENRSHSVVSLTSDLISFYRNVDSHNVSLCLLSVENKCKCSIRLAQVLVYALQVCARLLIGEQRDKIIGTKLEECLLTICRSGIAIIYLWTLRDFDLSILDQYVGRCQIFVDICQDMKEKVTLDEIQGQVLSELQATIQPTAEEINTSSNSKKPWLESFTKFHITD